MKSPSNLYPDRTLHLLVVWFAGLMLMTSPVQAAPRDEDGVVRESSTLFAEANDRIASGDYDGAISVLERALATLPQKPGYAPTRSAMLLLIVDAQESGFAMDDNLGRLRDAKVLLDQYLGPLELLDEQGRHRVEERRSYLNVEIGRVEASRSQAEIDRLREEKMARGEVASRQARRLKLAGTVTTSFGAAGLGIMAAGFGLGQAADARISELDDCAPGDDACRTESPPSCNGASREDCLAGLRSRGNSGNMMVITGASIGGALLVTGVVVLLVSRKKQREARSLEVVPSAQASLHGAGVLLRGRF